MPTMDEILTRMVELKGSDCHMKVGRPPAFRISGDLLPSEFPEVDKDEMVNLLQSIMTEREWNVFQEDLELDLGYAVEGVARFRVNVFHQQKQPGAVMRVIPERIPGMEELGLPSTFKDLVVKPQGMVLVTGPTGSGKSTTLASMLDYLNHTEPVHIVTIEDPIEFVYEDDKATINQRQIGQDVKSFDEALKRALRQDPDVILMGEMRDKESIEFGIHAAETGHMVFATLHTNDAAQTVDRILDSFPDTQQTQIRKMLALSLEAVISQRLLKRADGTGRIAVHEIMVNSPAIGQLIEEGKTGMIDKAIRESGSYYRMQTFNQALATFVKEGKITEEEAMENSTNPSDLKLMMRGIGGGGAKTDDEKEETPDAKAAEESDGDDGGGDGDEDGPKISKKFSF